jgi:hypothetical protein
MRIRTKNVPYWYVFRLHGVNFISWVSEKDRCEALDFDIFKAKKWTEILSNLSEMELECVDPYSLWEKEQEQK